MRNEDIHHVGDWRGKRKVFVNGNEIKRFIWADVRRGVVCFHPYPLRIHKRKRDEIYTRLLRGVITIEYL